MPGLGIVRPQGVLPLIHKHFLSTYSVSSTLGMPGWGEKWWQSLLWQGRENQNKIPSNSRSSNYKAQEGSREIPGAAGIWTYPNQRNLTTLNSVCFSLVQEFETGLGGRGVVKKRSQQLWTAFTVLTSAVTHIPADCPSAHGLWPLPRLLGEGWEWPPEEHPTPPAESPLTLEAHSPGSQDFSGEPSVCS